MIETHSRSAYNYPLLIKQLWHTPLACHADQEIVSGVDFRYTYQGLFSRVNQLANGLEALGVRYGDTVAVMDWDNHRYLECFFAIPMMGATLHTINIRLSAQQILYTINHAQDDVILLHGDFLPIIEGIIDQIEREIRFVFLTDDTDVEIPSLCVKEYESMLSESSEHYDFKDFDENTIATTFYTTGTTGDPKGVFYSHRQLVLHTMAVMGGLGVRDSSSCFYQGDVYMPITPMFHVHAWGFPYVATLMGVKQVYPGRYDPESILNLIEKESVTFSHCVPTILHMLLSHERASAIDLSRWKVIIGGSAFPQGLAKMATELGINAFAAYGLSETCPFLTLADMRGIHEVDSEEQTLARRCKTGIPAVMVDLKVVDAEMNELPRDGESTGEVVARSPWLTQGYAGNDVESDELWRGGYLHTGDVGYIDQNGCLQITDRIKDVIKSGGEWISSLVLESVISACDGVSEVAAVGMPNERWGERPVVFATIEKGLDQNEMSGKIKAIVQLSIDTGTLSKWAMPDLIKIVENLPKTSVGKMDKKVLRARLIE